MILALARHIFQHGTYGRFYSQVRKYHHEGGKVYWSMDPTPADTTLVNRCGEAQTYEARLAAGICRTGDRCWRGQANGALDGKSQQRL